MGVATHTEGIKKVCIVGGGVGCAIALPVAQKFHELGADVTSIIGFRNKDLLILEDEFKACSDTLRVMTDDGSYGEHGNVTVPLKDMLEKGEKFDAVITIGPLIMMKFVVLAVKDVYKRQLFCVHNILHQAKSQLWVLWVQAHLPAQLWRHHCSALI